MFCGLWKKGSEDLSDVYDLRREVFVQEQNIPEDLEFTGDDGEYNHLVIYENGVALATGRMSQVQDFKVHMGRICVRKDRRGERLGDFAVKIMKEKAFQDGALEAELDAQEHAVGFYEKLGFVKEHPVDEPSGIPHWHMKADLLK